MVSCMTDAPFGAIFAGVGLYFTSLILDQITSLGSIRYVLPTHYFDAWFDLVSRGQWNDDLWRGVLLQLVYVMVFFVVGLWWFRRKDIKS
jgi:ABC-2 type transport system permease protein